MRDLAAGRVHGVGDEAMLAPTCHRNEQLRGARLEAPAKFGAMPPVTIRPTPPRARSA